MANYKQDSMVDIAYELLTQSENPIYFYDLWNKIAELKEYDEDQRAEKQTIFYTNITLDGRIINVGENHWDLRDRHEFKEVHPDMNDYYDDTDDEDEYEEEVDDTTEEDDYN